MKLKLTILILSLLFGLYSCENLNDAAKLYRLGRRIEKVSEKKEKNPINSYRQNDWGLSTIMKFDTLTTIGIDYSVALLLPIDTTRSIELTIQMLPNMINNYTDKEATFQLFFIQSKTTLIEYRIKYIWIRNNKYNFEILDKIRQPNNSSNAMRAKV